MSMHPIKRILEILRYEKKEIWAIYFYAIFSGLVQLSLPIGIQSIISFVLGGSLSTSLVLLIVFVVSGVFISGLLQVNQMKIIEKIEQQLFVRYSFSYAYTIPKINLLKVDSYYLPELVNRFFDTVSLQKGLAKLLLEIPTATIQILFGLILLSLYHPIFIFFRIQLFLCSVEQLGIEVIILHLRQLHNGIACFYKITFFYMPFYNSSRDDGIQFLRTLFLPERGYGPTRPDILRPWQQKQHHNCQKHAPKPIAYPAFLINPVDGSERLQSFGRPSACLNNFFYSLHFS